MSGMFSVKKGTIYLDCNSKINNTSITNSSINMNGGVISSHGMPLFPTDVTSKQYVDSIFESNFLDVNVMLVSTNWTPFTISILSGQLRVSVKNIVTGGPSGSFDLTKSISNSGACISRTSSMAGQNTNERIELRWLSNTTVEIRKTGIFYDGFYNIKLYLNN
jgi:hypothetical protein